MRKMLFNPVLKHIAKCPHKAAKACVQEIAYHDGKQRTWLTRSIQQPANYQLVRCSCPWVRRRPQPARSTYIKRCANVTIREEVDQDGRGNDHAEQNCPDVERTKQQDGTTDEIQDLEDGHGPECPASQGP